MNIILWNDKTRKYPFRNDSFVHDAKKNKQTNQITIIIIKIIFFSLCADFVKYLCCQHLEPNDAYNLIFKSCVHFEWEISFFFTLHYFPNGKQSHRFFNRSLSSKDQEVNASKISHQFYAFCLIQNAKKKKTHKNNGWMLA